MYKRAVVWAALCVVLVVVVLGAPGVIPGRILALYKEADRLFHINVATPVTDSLALAGFERVIAETDKAGAFAGRDTLLFQSWLKKGILLDSKFNYVGARDAYRQALGYPFPNDSLQFLTYVNTGASYYNLNHFDSAEDFLLKAAAMTGNFRGKDDEARLYNTLGVLYFDNGNYLQAKNYFSRALEMLEGKKPLDTLSAVSLQINIATSHYHLHQYEEALAIYKQLLPYHLFTNQIYINIGNAYTGLERFREAMVYFRKVDAGKIPGVLNEMGFSEYRLHHVDSSAMYLGQLRERVRKGVGDVNKLDVGVNHLYEADLFIDRADFKGALDHLQQAIIIFSTGYTDTAVRSNPTNFTGTYAYYRLFDALLKKAEVLYTMSTRAPGGTALDDSYEAYQAALSLLRYIEKSYDTDDAKLFLKKRSAQAYEGFLAVCVAESRTGRKGDFMEAAFMMSEKSKASVITANLQENSFIHAQGVDSGMLEKVRNIKYNIARLNVRIEEASDKHELDSLSKEKTAYEIGLSELQKKMEQNGAFYQMKYQDAAPGVRELQRQLKRDEALVSFYVSQRVVYGFTVTREGFNSFFVERPVKVQEDVSAWLEALRTTENGRKFKGGAIGQRLYATLIKPMQRLVGDKEEWIIIPDGFLYFLPFESLPADDKGAQLLLETTTVSYRFSSNLLKRPGVPATADMNILSFAPFASGGQGSSFPALPGSRSEIMGLKGAQFLDAAATKAQFISTVHQYPIVHLATHAISSPNNAAASFIAFYPTRHTPLEDNLYLEELYGQDLSGTKLVIISACETGQGELAAKEGVISLSRAFAYAGVGSTIYSLWKADDKATSFILQRFYAHLREGASKAKALQKAKLDYLAGDALNKSPAFWSHLVLMGDSEAMYPRGLRWWWLLSILPAGAVGLVMWKRRKSRRY